jgi:tripartite-type tricarboxylate transporter receptor subunit TctC
MRALIGLIVGAAVLASGTSHAQTAGDYPNKPVRLVVPFAPGGPADLIARIIGQKFTEAFGKQFYVETIPGGGGNIGTAALARAPADGYSLLVNSQAIVINASLYKSLPYDPEKDLVAITRIANTPNVLIVHPSVPAKNVKELLELMRANPDKYHSYAHPGLGTPANLSGELFKLSQNIKLTSIPFGGGGPLAQSVLAGHTPVSFASLPPSVVHIQSGGIRALAVTGEKRVEGLPNVPTMEEAGFPGQIGETPIGILAPAGTPKEIVDLLHRKAVEIVAMPDVKAKLAAIGFSPLGDTPAQFAAYLKAENVKWARVIREAGLKIN